MKAGFYQFDPVFGEKDANIDKVIDVLTNADADLIVLPELFATGYQFVSHREVAQLAENIPDGNTTARLSELSRSTGMYIVAGLPESSLGHFHNSAVFVGPEGFIGTYRKTHLFYEETLWFTPGDTGFQVFETTIGRIGIMICFDWFFPEAMRTLALKGAQLVAHPSNLILPFCPDAMPIRCLENRVFAITANRIGSENRGTQETLTYIGMSQVTLPDGTIAFRAPEDTDALFVADVDLTKSDSKMINRYNDLFLDRRPDMYITGKHENALQ